MPDAFARAIRFVLISPPLMWCKRIVRDAIWSIRAPRVKNPDWPPRANSLLFVCYGNICRSPFAAHLAARHLHDAGITGVTCTSAGFRTSQNATSPPDAVAAAAAFGVSLEGHHPRLVTPELVARHDVVFVMEPSQLDTLRRRWPDYRERFFLLPLYEPPAEDRGAFERVHLVDPFGKGPAAFAHCYARIDAALHGLLRQWAHRQP